MKYVMIPSPVKLVEPRTGKPIKQQNEAGVLEDIPPVTMPGWNNDFIISNQMIGKGGDGIRRVIRLEKAFKEENLKVANGVKYAAVESDDHKMVMNIVNELTWQNMLVGKQYFVFMEAWEKALDELPKEEAKPAAQA
jgi:hypothetical protein